MPPPAPTSPSLWLCWLVSSDDRDLQGDGTPSTSGSNDTAPSSSTPSSSSAKNSPSKSPKKKKTKKKTGSSPADGPPAGSAKDAATPPPALGGTHRDSVFRSLTGTSAPSRLASPARRWPPFRWRTHTPNIVTSVLGPIHSFSAARGYVQGALDISGEQLTTGRLAFVLWHKITDENSGRRSSFF